MSKTKKNILYIASVTLFVALGIILIVMMNRFAAGNDIVFASINKITSSVINQALFIFALEVYGLLVMMCFNKSMKKLTIVMLSFIVGTLLWCLASVVVVCIGIPFTWYWVVIICILFLVALYLLLRPTKLIKEDFIFYSKTLVLYISIALFFAALCVFRFSYDSYMYVNTGMKIAKLGYLPNELIDIVSGFPLFTPMMFAPAVFFNYDFSQGVNLLINTQFTLFIGYVVYDYLKTKTTVKVAIIAGILSVITLVSSNIYFEMIYWPLSNMLTAMTLFGLIYFTNQSFNRDAKHNMILSAIFGMCFVLVRSENMLLYICIMFIVSLKDVNKRHLSLHIISAAVALSLWYMRFFIVAGLNFEEGAFLTIDRAIKLIALFAMFIIYALFISKSKFVSTKKKLIEKLFFVAMALVIILLGILKPDFFMTNLEATLVNVFYDGSWAGALLIIASLYFIKLAYEKKIDYYDKIIFIFILFYAIIFLLRAMPLRIGFGDSGNRYFAHILPIMVYTIFTTLGKKLIQK